jgi:hypothetical protein
MPFTITPYKLLAGAVAIVLLMLIAGFAGWHIKGWKDDSAQLKVANKATEQLAQQFTNVVDSYNVLAKQVEASNKATEDSIAGMTQALGEQDHEISKLQLDIKTIPVGSCQFTPDADSLYERAYQAAFGASNPATQTRKTDSSHATDRASPGAGRYQ